MDNGIIIYHGPSKLEHGTRIVAIVTGLARASANVKTGDILQTWILRADLDPIAAAATGQDRAVCGNCRGRRAADGWCYVNLGQAPLSVWSAWRRGTYADARHLIGVREYLIQAFAGRTVRLGSYGDPAAVPVDVWRAITRYADGHVGYTHQWRRSLARPLRELCMASTETTADIDRANDIGFASFRIRPQGSPTLAGETQCPAATGATTCSACKRCSGHTRAIARNVSIEVHGACASNFA